MTELVEKAVLSYLQTSDRDQPVRSANELGQRRLERLRAQVAEEAYRFFETATHPDFRRRVGSLATAGLIKPTNRGEIITYHGPFAVEYRLTEGMQLTVAKQIRLYDFRNGATGRGDPELHIEAAVASGVITGPDLKRPGTHILSTVKVVPENLSESEITVRGTDGAYGAQDTLDDPLSPSWDEILDDFDSANRFLESGRVAVSSWENNRLITSD